ncbi:MAG: hypothetical protein O9340_08125 [Cyclobacteriaceae bacterium]|nr:hypothetical protein [Cyclobacteriaceae bacterium]
MKAFWIFVIFSSITFTKVFGQEIIIAPEYVQKWYAEGENIKIPIKKNGWSKIWVEADINFGEFGIDSTDNFYWKPGFNLVDRIEKQKEFTFNFFASNSETQKVQRNITLKLAHQNRAPIVEELPVFYVKQATLNTYQIPADYVSDPDGDPIVFKSIVSEMPEDATLSSQGLLTWKPSKSQFNGLKNNPQFVTFIVQDQPEKAETKARIKIAQTQQDLPPEILVVPADTFLTIKEDETINLKLYLSDPNGDDNIRSSGFVATDLRVPKTAFQENTLLQNEFIWTPGYDFVNESQKQIEVQFTFFVLDKSNNRSQKRLKIRVLDAENLIEKDALQYMKYKSTLWSAAQLITILDQTQKQLNVDYKKARKGKKHRSILNASLGAVTGVSPLAFEADQAKVVSSIGGTTVLTLGTLEATEVIGRSKEAILEKIKIDIELRNKVQSVGDEFAKKYALKSARRNLDFEKDIDKLRAAMNDQRLVLLEIDAQEKRQNKEDLKLLKKTFIDFAEE